MELTFGPGWSKYIGTNVQDYHYLADALIRIPSFQEALSAYYEDTFRDAAQSLVGSQGIIAEYAEKLYDSTAMNYKLWPLVKVGDPSHAEHLWASGTTYADVIDTMQNWAEKRIQVLDERFGGENPIDGNTTNNGNTGNGPASDSNTGNGSGNGDDTSDSSSNTGGNHNHKNSSSSNSSVNSSNSVPSVSYSVEGDLITLDPTEINANGVTTLSKTETAAPSAEEAEPLTIQVSSSTEKLKIEIPVSGVTSGTVVAIVNEDGSLTVLKKSVITENGVLLSVEGTTTVKIFNNAKSFSDVSADHWAAEQIDFVSSRGLLVGTEDGFKPELPLTRGMMMMVLASLNDVDTSVTSGNWYDKAMEWSVGAGISDGTNPTENITREQMVQMLWRIAGSPTVSGDLSGYTDAASVSDYARNAMNWAVSNGIISGMDHNTLAPDGIATRAQVAAVMMKLCNLMAK
jgi:hypothetical protein